MQDDLKRYIENWQSELDSVAQYRAMAQKEHETRIKALYEKLALVEEGHMKFWEEQIIKIGGKVPKRRPSWRSRFLISIAKIFGSTAILGTIADKENADRNIYTVQNEASSTRMTHDERLHAEVLRQLVRTQGHGVSGRVLGRIEGRHKAVSGNALRAAVLGANDGLSSNLSLVMGVAGASSNSNTLILTGLAGLFAGAFSMALGEWLSVTSSRELAEREIRVESDELRLDPESEAEELCLIYEAKGIPPKEARDLVNHIMQDPQRAIETLTREELGIDPSDLSNSARVAASFSFILFALGAIIPVLPFFFLTGSTAIITTVVCSGLALFGIGALITVFTNRSVWFSGFRQLFLGGMAALVTHILGRIIGGSL